MDIKEIKIRIIEWLQMELPFAIPNAIRIKSVGRNYIMDFEDFYSYFGEYRNKRFCRVTFKQALRGSKSTLKDLKEIASLMDWYKIELPREAYRLYLAGTYKK